MSLAPGASVGRYRIVSALGAGGMGEVYEAEDTRLGRRVALKFLPEGLARDPLALERFEREARAASALNHPHICTIHDIGEADATGSGQAAPFMAMELLEGQTLKVRLLSAQGSRLRAQGLPTDELLRIALQLADALEAAHGKGILHRDIKPANVFLTTRGTTKLLDFGIAKLAADPHPADTAAETAGGWVTGAGVTLGTVGYMSPEQVRGEAVDARSDLFSLGVVLYEMTTGTAPFRGATSGVVLSEILTKAPTAPVKLNPHVPPDLERIVNALLEKDRVLRYQSAAALRSDLERLTRGLAEQARDRSRPHRAEQASIVVLPFENLSPDPENAFFADGLTEELIAELSGVRTLRVISRTSAMHYKGTTKPLPAIARELNVRHVLEGSVRRAGNNLRITAQLIDSVSDAHLWAERYSGTLDDVFDLQERLARRIVEALRLRLTTGEDRRLSGRPLPDPRAYDAWLRARQELFKWTPEALDLGWRLIDEALSIVGDNALLFAAASTFGWATYDSGYRHDDLTLLEADRFAAKALELDPQLSDAHAAVGLVRYKQVGLHAAMGPFRRAVDLGPNGFASFFLGFGLAEIGRTEEARRYADETLLRDPLVPINHLSRTAVDLFDGDALAAYGRVRDAASRLEPDGVLLNWWTAQTAAYAGLDGEAREGFARVAGMDAGAFSDMSRLACLALDGDRSGVLQILDSTSVAVLARTDEWYPNFLATYLARVGEYGQAMSWLEAALAWGFSNHRFWAEHNRFFAPLRGDARFEALIDRARVRQREFDLSKG